MLIELTQSNLPNYFTPTDKKFLLGDSKSPVPAIEALLKLQFDAINLYNFKSRNSQTLLVTIGDSWTWGSDLSGYHDFLNPCSHDWKADNNVLFNINHLRLTEVYGNLVSEHIASDWLNLSVPGGGNFTIAKLAQQLGNLIPQLKYKKIILICALTEIGRGFDNSEMHSILDHDKIMHLVEQTLDINTLLIELNKSVVEKVIDSINSFPHVQLLIGTNFVDAIGFDALLPHQILQRPWYQLLNISFDEPTYLISHLAWGDFARSMENGLIAKKLQSLSGRWRNRLKYLFQSWITEVEEKEWLKRSIVTRKQKNFFLSWHPDSNGHQVWAEYIIKHLCQYN